MKKTKRRGGRGCFQKEKQQKNKTKVPFKVIKREEISGKKLMKHLEKVQWKKTKHCFFEDLSFKIV